MKRLRPLASLLAAMALVAGACTGDDGASQRAGTGETQPVTWEQGG